MNDPVFASMRSQMTPSQKARDELADKLVQAAPGKPVFWRRCAAVAACAALALCIYPAYNALKPAPALHSYVMVEGGGAPEKTVSTVTGNTEDEGGKGDRDQAMTPDELTEAMEEVGFSTGDIDAYQAMGYQMTWSKWWKFVGRQRDSEGAEPFNLASLEAFSREELSVNTGDLPDPFGGDVPVQPGVDAYQLLMVHFGGTEPDWYGGAYVDKSGTLMVLLVTDKDPGDKSLELEVLDAVGEDVPVSFTGAKYSRSELERLNQEILSLMEGTGIFASMGIDDVQNRIVLDIFETPTDDLLIGLARLDPDGDAILVRVVEGGTMVTDEAVKGPAPVNTVGEEDSGDIDVVHRLPGGATIPDEEDISAIEPYHDETKDLQAKEPAREERQPSQTEDAD